MVRAAARPEYAIPQDRAEAGRDDLVAETAESMRALEARLAAAQRRAAAADLRQRQSCADHAATMQSQSEDVRNLEETVSELTVRARAYNRALNEAATLVDELDNRILFFERQLAAVQDMLAAANHVAPRLIRKTSEITEDGLSQDLDLIRKCETTDPLNRLRSRLGLILVA